MPGTQPGQVRPHHIRRRRKKKHVQRSSHPPMTPERFEAMSRLYYRSARAACVCYDLTRSETWPKVKFWINELLSFEKDCAMYTPLPSHPTSPVEQLITKGDNITRSYIVGTKADLLAEGQPRGVEAQVVDEYARQIHAQVYASTPSDWRFACVPTPARTRTCAISFETSARTGAGVDELFDAIVFDYVQSGSRYHPGFMVRCACAEPISSLLYERGEVPAGDVIMPQPTATSVCSC